MLITLIIIAVVSLLLTFVLKGFCLYAVALLIPTLMFCGRKVGVHIRLANIATCEIVFLFLSIVWSLLFNKLDIIRLILVIIVRLIFLCAVLYDDKTFVYVKEERKKQ